MRHIKRYAELFENETTLTAEQKEFLNKHTRGSWMVNPTTGMVDVKGDFVCRHCGIKTLLGIKFGVVSGSFYCSHNNLTSLEGAPREVGGKFTCSNNPLTSLKGAPERVGGYFYLMNSTDGFKWTTEGKLEYMTDNPEKISLILPTLPYDFLIDAVSEDPTLLKTIENLDKVLYNKVLKGLGWDKMGPDLLRQLKDGIL